ncbi:MAG: riboflavin biosynthesis protein RibF [Chloroflexi bacterium]|nr:riboflavin biosynthesis protein RibF [Chloroflexota bacterium]
MSFEAELARYQTDRDTLLTVGVFDGVHLGHQHLLKTLVENARRHDLLPGVVTFGQHPDELLSPSGRLPYLTSLEKRLELLRRQGVPLIVPLSFTRELAACPARRFVTALREHLRMRGLVIGPDFALGRRREGDPARLAELGREMGFSVTVAPPFVLDGEVVSSTAIRKALAAGDMDRAGKLFGRPFGLHGPVVKGAGRGAGLGFPTANLGIDRRQALPPDGVYAGWAFYNGQKFAALTNIGTCPTFGDCPRTVEVYLVDFTGDLYGRDLEVDIVQRLREEKKFTSVDALRRQMTEDVRRGIEMLGVKK